MPELLTAETNDLTVTIHADPTHEEIDQLAQSWDLHPVLIEDLIDANQRPKLERYGNVLFLTARSASYLDGVEEILFGEFHLLAQSNAVAILCQDGRWIDGSKDFGKGLLDNQKLLEHGPVAVVYHMLDALVDGYLPVLESLETDKEEIESQVFAGDTNVTERIYRLTREVVELQHAVTALARVLEQLLHGYKEYERPEQLQAYLRDVSDHLAHVVTETQEMREALAQILDVNATLVAQRQNEDMKKVSGWAAIFFAPTLVGAIYGMNFDVMPELHWAYGYPLALAAMVVFTVVLYVIFKHKKWM